MKKVVGSQRTTFTCLLHSYPTLAKFHHLLKKSGESISQRDLWWSTAITDVVVITVEDISTALFYLLFIYVRTYLFLYSQLNIIHVFIHSMKQNFKSPTSILLFYAQTWKWYTQRKMFLSWQIPSALHFLSLLTPVLSQICRQTSSATSLALPGG